MSKQVTLTANELNDMRNDNTDHIKVVANDGTRSVVNFIKDHERNVWQVGTSTKYFEDGEMFWNGLENCRQRGDSFFFGNQEFMGFMGFDLNNKEA